MPVKPGRMSVKTRSILREPVGSISSLSSPVRSTAARHSITREERHNAQLAAVVAASDDAIKQGTPDGASAHPPAAAEVPVQKPLPPTPPRARRCVDLWN